MTDRVIQFHARLNLADYNKLKRLGGSRWLIKQIEIAQLPVVQQWQTPAQLNRLIVDDLRPAAAVACDYNVSIKYVYGVRARDNARKAKRTSKGKPK